MSYEYYTNLQASQPTPDDLPDEWGDDEYVGYCETEEAAGRRPLDFVDWQHENFQYLYESYTEYLADLKAEYQLEREGY